MNIVVYIGDDEAQEIMSKFKGMCSVWDVYTALHGDDEDWYEDSQIRCKTEVLARHLDLLPESVIEDVKFAIENNIQCVWFSFVD